MYPDSLLFIPGQKDGRWGVGEAAVAQIHPTFISSYTNTSTQAVYSAGLTMATQGLHKSEMSHLHLKNPDSPFLL